jgi:hypothetical protein
LIKVPPLSFRREDIPDLSTGERTDKLLRGLNAFGAEAERLLNGGVSLTGNCQAFAKELSFTTRDEWTAASLTNSWANVGGFQTAAYRKRAGRVWLRGSVYGGTLAAAAFTLPVGYRPWASVGAAVGCSVAPASLTVDSNGVALIDGAAGVSAAGVSLDGLSFQASDEAPVPNPVFPLRIKNELDAEPSHVWVTRAVDVTDGRETPITAGGVAWSLSKDQIVIRDVANLLAGRKIKLTIIAAAE